MRKGLLLLAIVAMMFSFAAHAADDDTRYGMMDGSGNFYAYGMMGSNDQFYPMAGNNFGRMGMMMGGGGMMGSGMMYGSYGSGAAVLAWIYYVAVLALILSATYWLVKSANRKK